MKGPEAVDILDETPETAKDLSGEELRPHQATVSGREYCIGYATIAAGSNVSTIALPLPTTRGEGKGDPCASWLTRVVCIGKLAIT